MNLKEIIFGRRRSEEEESVKLGTPAGIPLLGFDALASAAYGPEAALTVLIALGTLASGYIIPITGIIIALLIAVAMSYRHTIPAYPSGGGSFTVAKENLGPVVGLFAANALQGRQHVRKSRLPTQPENPARTNTFKLLSRGRVKIAIIRHIWRLC